MAKKDWQVGPVLRDKPGSQGTLFRGGTKYSSEARYPRGYSPERLGEVKEAMGPQNTMSYYLRNHGTGPQRRRMIDTVARSTVPAEHLQGVQFTPGQRNLDLGPRDPSDFTHTAGRYHRRELPPLVSGTVSDQKAAGPGKPARISIREGYEDAPTVIHEIGHHVSAVAGTEHSAYDTTQKQGTEEGFADEYAHEHFRDRRGQASTFKRIYAGGQRSATRTDEFYGAYHQHRGTEDIDWSKPSQLEVERNRQRAEENASALFQKVEPTTGEPFAGLRTNPEAVPKGVTPEQVLTPSKPAYSNPTRTNLRRPLWV